MPPFCLFFFVLDMIAQTNVATSSKTTTIKKAVEGDSAPL